METFKGAWTDHKGVKITVEEQSGMITLTYANKRGPFNGGEVDVPTPVITVYFDDDDLFSGVLSKDGKTIYWNNGTLWNRA